MVKVTGPLFSVRARGSLGDGISFQGSGAGVRVERRPRHRDRQSLGQLAHRDLFLEAVAYWHGLTAEQKVEYGERGEVAHITGYNLCLREYLLGVVGPGPPVGGVSELEVLAVGGVEVGGMLSLVYGSHAEVWAVEGE